MNWYKIERILMGLGIEGTAIVNYIDGISEIISYERDNISVLEIGKKREIEKKYKDANNIVIEEIEDGEYFIRLDDGFYIEDIKTIAYY